MAKDMAKNHFNALNSEDSTNLRNGRSEKVAMSPEKERRQKSFNSRFSQFKEMKRIAKKANANKPWSPRQEQVELKHQLTDE